MEIGGRQLHAHAPLGVVAVVKAAEQAQIIFQRQLKPFKPALHWPAQFGRQACDEILIRLINKAVLVTQREAIGNAHADIFISADDLTRALFHIGQFARRPAMLMLHGRDARPDHLKGGIERIEVGVHIARHHARDEPKLQRHIRGAQLQRRQPDMVMRIDEAR